jgi:hypothetical protein
MAEQDDCKIVLPRCQPIRSTITVAGIAGVSRKSLRICTLTASTAEPFSGRSYFGGRPAQTTVCGRRSGTGGPMSHQRYATP